MQGEYCHACGQSIHSVIKPIHGMLEDTLDIVFHVDGRVLHTLPPLFARPGFLTLEYFSGWRVRYIAPFRLMFVLSLLAFFSATSRSARSSCEWANRPPSARRHCGRRRRPRRSGMHCGSSRTRLMQHNVRRACRR